MTTKLPLGTGPSEKAHGYVTQIAMRAVGLLEIILEHDEYLNPDLMDEIETIIDQANGGL
jgi:hypothetical protein